VQTMWSTTGRMEAAVPRPFSWALFLTLFPAFPALCPSLLACFQGCACVLVLALRSLFARFGTLVARPCGPKQSVTVKLSW